MDTKRTQTADRVMLVAFYNKKALGVRYLETALREVGYDVRTVYYKDFNSVRPKKTSQQELELLRQDIQQQKPMLIALSVMSSMYLETVDALVEMVQKSFDIPIVCGGAYATMFPEYFLDKGVEFVIRSDGERAICRLASCLKTGEDYSALPSLCYRQGGQNVINDIGDILNEIDGYGLPTINCLNACFIENDTLHEGDPQLETLSYEVIASRGCPFTCSYCCCVNLRRLLPRGIKGVRTRSVESVMAELIEAKQQCKKMVFVHFYDEIFPNAPGWVDQFIVEYKKHINLPFTIWSHPKMVDMEMMKKLKSVGLVEVIMGIQSGSEHIRRDVFHRFETDDDIVEATRIIHEAGVFWDSFDFMLQHPFESIEDLKDSYYLAKRLCKPRELQLHGLNFLPGTDIVPLAIKEGYYTQEEMDKVMYAGMDEQFNAYWERTVSRESELWFRMLYCLQFPHLRRKIVTYEGDPLAHAQEIDSAYEKGLKLAKFKYLYKKSRVALKKYTMKVFR